MDKVEFQYGSQSLFDDFRITSFIARGNAMVYEVENSSGEVQCVKECRLSNKDEQEIFQREVKLLSEIRESPHPHIIQFKGWYVTRDARNSLNVFKNGYIQMEKALTSLQQLIQVRLTGKGELDFFKNYQVARFVKSMIQSHYHLQTLSLAHRDIKPDNILLTSLDPMHFKICDIGVGTQIQGDITKTHTLMGTVSYLSPELYNAYMFSEQFLSYNPFKSDVYSLGLVILFFCTLKKVTNRDRQDPNTINQIRRTVKKRYKNVRGLNQLLKQMLLISVTDRPDFVSLQEMIDKNLWLEVGAGQILQLKKGQQESITKVQEINKMQIYSKGEYQLSTLKIILNNFPKQNSAEVFQELRKIRYLSLRKLHMQLELYHSYQKHY